MRKLPKHSAPNIFEVSVQATGQIADITFGRYQTFGEITIETGHESTISPEMKYRRDLNLSTGIHTVEYKHDGTKFSREMFCSYPDRCLAMRFFADQPKKQNLHLKLASPHAVSGAEKEGVFVVSGKLENNGLLLDARIGVLHKGGEITIDSEGIHVAEADEVAFILVAGTDYAPISPKWRGEAPAIQNSKRLEAALAIGYNVLRKRHIDDHSALHRRVHLNLGTTPSDVLELPTDQRVALNKKQPDPELEALYFQFGRYLLIASSRPGGLPANLQGIWCNETIPAWNSDYHLNINLQMNYWLSGSCNLLECQEPLIDYIDAMRAPGAVTAKEYNNAGGWTAHLSGNIWGATSPHPGKKPPSLLGLFSDGRAVALDACLGAIRVQR